MKKISAILTSVLLVSLISVSLTAQAAPKGQPTAGVVVPDRAKEVSQGIYSLGVAIDPITHRRVEGLMIVHRRDGQAKPDHAGKKKKGSSCYAPLAKGAKWKTNEPWLVNASNTDSLSDAFVRDTLTAGIAKWETAANHDILGDGSLTPVILEADTEAPDGANEAYFGAIEDPNTIAITIVWGYFTGPSRSRELIEWDQVYNTAYAWTDDAAVETDKMDFDSLATHELGHSVGLDDLYSLDCVDETMYGYASEGEINKRDLEAGDIAGINSLY